jgi:hypothetical protein
MHSKIARDHNDHDHYADDVKDIHCFSPSEKAPVFNVPGFYFNDRRESDLGLSKNAHRCAIRRAGYLNYALFPFGTVQNGS